ncbi:MAG: NAD(P)/FAD-dependent oxidoreductase [Hyphomicrobiaceae bacterium]
MTTAGDGLLFAEDQSAGQYPPSYYAASANPHEPYPALTEDVTADVCVVGGGYTGLSAALHLAEAGLDVVLLEAHRVGWGASGRNGGQLGSGLNKDQIWLERVAGTDNARMLWDIAEAAKALVRERVARHRIACGLKPGILNVIYDVPRRRSGGQARRGTEEYRAYATHLHDRYGYDQLEIYEGDALRAQVGSPAYVAGMLDRGAGHLHPLNLALGLADAAQAAGARIFEQTAVSGYKTGSPVRVTANKRTVTVQSLVLGCNAYLDDLAPGVARKVMPINNFIVATEPLDADVAASLIRDDVAVSDSKFVINYFRLSADRRLLFGGGETYSYRLPKDIAAIVRKPMLDIYPQLRDVRIDHAWGGTLGITSTRLPHFARPSPNIWSASGYSGHGVGLANMAGKILADAVGGTMGQFDVLARLPNRAFPGGARLRHPLLVLAMSWYALRDRLGF